MLNHWICCQIGAREHYAVPRALNQQKRLGALYTDFWAGPLARKLAAQMKLRLFRSFAARYHPELAESPVRSWNHQALLWESFLGRGTAQPTPYHGYIKVGHQFAARVCQALKRRSDLDSRSIFFAYDTGAMEAMEWCKQRGIRCVLDQIDPHRVEFDLVREEAKRWPGWAPEIAQVPEEYLKRRDQEWALADRIVVNSDFSREALLKQGVPEKKLVVIPLCYEPNGTFAGSALKNCEPGEPLRVLFLGQVILRKGIQYLMQTARLLEQENIHFDIVGPIGISQQALATTPRNMTFHGRAARNQAASWYERSHVFVLPTLLDGFAITQLEAMAHGLPVISTPCSGKVVCDGTDGFIVPPRDPEALAKSLLRYRSEPGLLLQHRNAALEKSKKFTLARLTDHLLNLESELAN